MEIYEMERNLQIPLFFEDAVNCLKSSQKLSIASKNRKVN